MRTNTSEASLLSGLPGWRAWPRKCRNRSKILPIPPKKTFRSRSKIILVGREAERFDDAPLTRAGDLIIIMNVGQHSPPRRELWSYNHPSFKTIPPKEGFVSSNSQVSTRRPILRQFETYLLTRSSRFFQRMYYCNVGHNRTRQSRGHPRICAK